MFLHVILAISVWLVGCFLLPKFVEPLEVGYGVVTIVALLVWTVAMVILGFLFV